jgi:hypothetical protein
MLNTLNDPKFENLHQQSGVSESAIRRLFTDKKKRYVGVDTVDRLLCSFDRPDLWYEMPLAEYYYPCWEEIPAAFTALTGVEPRPAIARRSTPREVAYREKNRARINALQNERRRARRAELRAAREAA